MKTMILGMLTVGLLGVGTAANASVLRLDATAGVDAEFSDFFVVFNDSGDGLLQLEELVSFSGTVDISDGSLYNLLIGVPTIADVSSAGGFCPVEDWWCFVSPEVGLLVAISPDTFSYAISPHTAPEPGTLALLSLGFASLSIRKRREA